MNHIYRKELINFNTGFLIKIKNTILNKTTYTQKLSKPENYMLIDVLSELDTRKIDN
ncbi:MAG TPA: hypothetical protein PLN85_02435 [archaeon]|jgi:hypothetical protein|nr:hypothetical protein [archaeon]HRT03469.1 hypothetical protein [Candidatus Diapherotrites archaeon]